MNCDLRRTTRYQTKPRLIFIQSYSYTAIQTRMKLFDREDRATNKQNAVITKTQHTLHRCAEIHSRMPKKNKTSSLLTVYASFLQVKHWSTELEEELQRDIKKVSYV